MNVLVYLVPMALGLGLTALFAFLWSMRSGQYEDLEGAALRVLSDDDVPGALSGVSIVDQRAWHREPLELLAIGDRDTAPLGDDALLGEDRQIAG